MTKTTRKTRSSLRGLPMSPGTAQNTRRAPAEIQALVHEAIGSLQAILEETPGPPARTSDQSRSPTNSEVLRAQKTPVGRPFPPGMPGMTKMT